MLRTPTTLGLVGTLLLSGACADYNETTALPGFDYERFVTEIQPILASSCANPSCHGSATHTLEAYAVYSHRLDPKDLYLDTPLTEEELRSNCLSAVGFLVDVEDPDDSALLRKPLTVAAGGAEHGGGAQFAALEDWQYVRMLAWISDALE